MRPNIYTQRALHAFIRWAILKDKTDILGIDQECFPDDSLDEDALRDLLRRPDVVCQVAEYGAEGKEMPVGYMIYDLGKTTIGLLRIGVAGCVRGRDVGRQLIDKLKPKLSAKRRQTIEADVCELNLNALCFFRALGFRAEHIEHRAVKDDDGEYRDIIRMVYRVGT